MWPKEMCYNCIFIERITLALLSVYVAERQNQNKILLEGAVLPCCLNKFKTTDYFFNSRCLAGTLIRVNALGIQTKPW